MEVRPNRPLFAYAVFTAAITLGLICMGGLVTSKGVGMAVPDWPTSFGYNMFALPVQQWFHGGVFDEHTHRLWASTVGFLVVMLTRWLGGANARKPLALIGGIEVAAGLGFLTLGSDWKGVGHFLAGIGGVVLLAAVVGSRNPAASGLLPRLGWAVFGLVQLQGLLGGLRVVLDKAMIGQVTLGTVFGLLHGCLGQVFFVLLGTIALFTSPWWISQRKGSGGEALAWIAPWFWTGTVLIGLQLLLGAAMRHQHAGLAIPDFPLAYGQIWPRTDPSALLHYNQVRSDESTVTGLQIQMQMLHRMGATLTLLVVLGAWIRAAQSVGWRSSVTRGATVWAVLVLMQFSLGMLTIWTNKAADVATAHVAGGALLFLVGTLLILIVRKLRLPARAPIQAESMPALARSAAR